jgi:uncharacterized protein
MPCSALEVPALSGRVVDTAHLLPADVAQSLDREMAEHERRTGNQVAVLTIPSLEGESLEEYSHRVATTWKLGGNSIDNGVLLLVVSGERRIRIEVGYGLEGTLTDAASSQIIRRVIVPKFRAGDVPGGVAAGVRAILGTIDGTYTAPERNTTSGTDDRSGVFLIAVLIGALIGGPLLGGRLKLLGGAVSAALSFVIALPAGLKLAILAGFCGMIAALVLAALFGSAGSAGRGGRQWRGSGRDVGWGPGLGGGGWSGNDSFSGGGGDFGGGGASGRW